jgi:hypothetical protein
VFVQVLWSRLAQADGALSQLALAGDMVDLDFGGDLAPGIDLRPARSGSYFVSRLDQTVKSDRPF